MKDVWGLGFGDRLWWLSWLPGEVRVRRRRDGVGGLGLWGWDCGDEGMGLWGWVRLFKRMGGLAQTDYKRSFGGEVKVRGAEEWGAMMLGMEAEGRVPGERGGIGVL